MQHAQRPNDHGHSSTGVRAGSTNHLCRCEWKDKISRRVLTVSKREKVEGKSRGKKKEKKKRACQCNDASCWQLPAGIKLLCKQCHGTCKIHYFLIIFEFKSWQFSTRTLCGGLGITGVCNCPIAFKPELHQCFSKCLSYEVSRALTQPPTQNPAPTVWGVKKMSPGS